MFFDLEWTPLLGPTLGSSLALPPTFWVNAAFAMSLKYMSYIMMLNPVTCFDHYHFRECMLFHFLQCYVTLLQYYRAPWQVVQRWTNSRQISDKSWSKPGQRLAYFPTLWTSTQPWSLTFSPLAVRQAAHTRRPFTNIIRNFSCDYPPSRLPPFYTFFPYEK